MASGLVLPGALLHHSLNGKYIPIMSLKLVAVRIYSMYHCAKETRLDVAIDVRVKKSIESYGGMALKLLDGPSMVVNCNHVTTSYPYSRIMHFTREGFEIL
jgi:hypothetical protein